VFSLQFHLVWCPKYRRPVLTPPVDGRVQALLAAIADEHGMTIRAAEVMPDHVHLFVEADRRSASRRS
jgi:putative transposase